MARSLFTLLVVLALCASSFALLRCQNFDTLALGSIYSNTTGFPPGRYISQTPVRFDGQKFFGDPSGRYYGSVVVQSAANVSSFFTSPSIGGNLLDLRNIVVEFDFRNVARGDQPKYIRFEFYDFGVLQNLRINNGTVYKGSLVSIEERAGVNAYWFAKRQRRFVPNLGEIFVANNATRLERFWIGGDRLYIDNVCWDEEWHQHPKLKDNAAASLVASVAGVLLAGLVALMTTM